MKNLMRLVLFAVACVSAACETSVPVTDDIVMPDIMSTVPDRNATGVPVSSSIVLTFSEAMDTASVKVSSSPAVAFDAAIWTSDNTVATLSPSAPLAFATEYSLTIEGNDLAGNPLPKATRLAFVTDADTIAPTIVSTSPEDHATDVSPRGHIEVVFSEAMDAAGVQVEVVDGTLSYDLGAPTWSADQTKVSFLAPPAPFAFSTTYTVTINGNDKLGIALASTSFSFKVLPQPAVLSTVPANNASGVLATSPITLEFNQPMERASVEAAFSTSPAITCGWVWSADSKTTSCLPTSQFGFSMSYMAMLEDSARSAAGDTLAAPYGFAFTIGAEQDTTQPTMTSASPLANSGDSLRNVSISLTFSEQMDQVSTQTAFSIHSPANVMGGTFSWNTAGDVMTYKPPADFAYGDTVAWTLSTLAEDLRGNQLAAQVSTTFRVVKKERAVLEEVATTGARGSVSSQGGIVGSSYFLQVGDNSANTSWRAFATFDLATLPSSMIAISYAELNVNLSYVSPPTGLGLLYAESVDYGPDLSGEDFGVTTDCLLLTAAGCRSRGRYELPQVVGTYGADVTAKVNYDLKRQEERQKRVQFRVAFENETDNDGIADLIQVRQQLLVDYEYSW